MEPMDFDSDGEQNTQYSQKLSAADPNMSGRDSRSDFSDMDVDHSSPDKGHTAVRSSTSFEHISNVLCSVLSLKNVSDSKSHLNDKRPLTPSQEIQRLSSVSLDFSNAWQPATTAALAPVGLRNEKMGYGIPYEETDFAHFPDPGAGSSVRKRQPGNERTSDAKVQQKPVDSSEVNYQSHMDSHSHDQLKLPVPPESRSKRHCTCFGFMSSVVLVLLFIIGVHYTLVLQRLYEREKCKLSRDFNKRVLKIELEANVFGQHLAARIVPDKIEEYFSKLHDNSLSQQSTVSADGGLLLCKPLVLSFEGWTGVGKNYISRFISETFQYSRVINYIIPLNFPHKSFEDVNRLQIQQWIRGNFTECMVNIFVLDEMDKAFPGVVEGLTEAINDLTQPCSSASPTIFLLLSNTHANDINRTFLKFMLDSSTNRREQLSEEHFSSIFASELNVWSSALINSIDAFVPFLPLEREHVIQCIKRDLISKRFSTDVGTVKRVLHELSFSSFGDIHLSKTGCKRVADKVDLIIFEKQQ